MATIHLTTGESIEVEDTYDDLEALIMIESPGFIMVDMKISECIGYEVLNRIEPIYDDKTTPACINVNHIAYIQ